MVSLGVRCLGLWLLASCCSATRRTGHSAAENSMTHHATVFTEDHASSRIVKETSLLRGAEPAPTPVQALTATEQREIGSKPISGFPSFNQGYCVWMLLAWFVATVFSGVLFGIMGEGAGHLCQVLIIFGVIVYVIASGLLDAWWSGQPVQLTCQLVCWLVLFNLLFTAFFCLVSICCGTASILQSR